MQKQEVIQKVNQVMGEYFEIPEEKLVPESHLINDLELDSLDAVDMLVHLEDQLETKVDAEQFQSINTLGEVYDLVEKLNTPKN